MKTLSLSWGQRSTTSATTKKLKMYNSFSCSLFDEDNTKKFASTKRCVSNGIETNPLKKPFFSKGSLQKIAAQPIITMKKKNTLLKKLRILSTLLPGSPWTS